MMTSQFRIQISALTLKVRTLVKEIPEVRWLQITLWLELFRGESDVLREEILVCMLVLLGTEVG